MLRVVLARKLRLLERIEKMLKSGKWIPAVALGSVMAAVVLVVAMTSQQKPQAKALEPIPIVTETVAEVVMAMPEGMNAETPVKEVQEESPVETESRELLASNQYIQFKHPTVNSSAFVYEQEVDEEVIIEKYSMIVAGEKKILYQINFGKEKEGNWLGLLELDADEISVTYTIYAVSDEELMAMNETERQHYSELMSGLGHVLESITSDPRFRMEKSLPVGETKAVHLTYWTVELPGNMTWTETNEDNEYQAIFYGVVQGERVALYMVRIGEVEAQTVLGKYRVDGAEKKVSVESYDLPRYESWVEQDYSTAYQMMATINDVIQIIESSANFIAE